MNFQEELLNELIIDLENDQFKIHHEQTVQCIGSRFTIIDSHETFKIYINYPRHKSFLFSIYKAPFGHLEIKAVKKIKMIIMKGFLEPAYCYLKQIPLKKGGIS